MSSIASITGAKSASNETNEAPLVPQKTLSQEDFFQLLIAQMTSQDPMNPVSNAEFMGQMAQFSTLEQTRTLEANISAMRTEQQMVQANTLIGRNVTLQIGSSYVDGMVTAVEVEGGTPKVVVNGETFDLKQVVTIKPALELI